MVTDPVEVARLFVARFRKWIAGGATGGGYWYHKAAVNQPDRRGRRLRAAIAEEGAAFELAGSGIPARFRSVLKHLQRLPATDPVLYDGIFTAIIEKEWSNGGSTSRHRRRARRRGARG